MSDSMTTGSAAGSLTRVVDCDLCGKPTKMTATKRCDRCWELERRVQDDPDIARKVLIEVSGQQRAYVLAVIDKMRGVIEAVYRRWDEGDEADAPELGAAILEAMKL